MANAPETTASADALVIEKPSPEKLLRQAMAALTRPVPSTKGLGPADRANRLHADIERRIADAHHALRIST